MNFIRVLIKKKYETISQRYQKIPAQICSLSPQVGNEDPKAHYNIKASVTLRLLCGHLVIQRMNEF